jgi:hypothetical protein
MDAVDSSESALASQLAFQGSGATPYILDIYLGPSGADYEEEIPGDAGVTYTHYPLSQQPVVGSWSHLALDVDFVAVTAKVTVDGAVAYAGALDPGYTAGTVTLNLGTGYYTSPGTQVGPAAARFDNVVLDVKKAASRWTSQAPPKPSREPPSVASTLRRVDAILLHHAPPG